MKKYVYIPFVITVLTIFFSFIHIQIAKAIIAGVDNRFIPTDNDSDFYTFYNLSPNWYFGVYDYKEAETNGLFLLGDSNQSAQFQLEQQTGKWILKVTEGVDEGKTIELGDTKDFSFFFYDGDNYYTPIISQIGKDKFVFKNNNDEILGFDLRSVPIPSAIWLLGIGVLGVIMLGNRKRLPN